MTSIRYGGFWRRFAAFAIDKALLYGVSLFLFLVLVLAGGLDLPHWEHVAGWDTNIFVAVLSRFPFAARRSHTNENFLLHGRRFHVSRGFAEVDIQVNPRYTLTLLVLSLIHI